MRRNITFCLLGGAFLLIVAQAASAQEEKPVPFKEQSEELQGVIYMVEAESGLMFLEKNAVTYSFKITPSTRITVNNQTGDLAALTARKGVQASVKFRVTRDGNIAQGVTVSSMIPSMISRPTTMPCPMMGSTGPGPRGCPHRE